MKLERVEVPPGAVSALFKQWARVDGAGRAERVAAAQRAAAPVVSGSYRDSITVVEEQHPTRPVFHIGPTVPYGAVVEARHGLVARSIDAAGG